MLASDLVSGYPLLDDAYRAVKHNLELFEQYWDYSLAVEGEGPTLEEVLVDTKFD